MCVFRSGVPITIHIIRLWDMFNDDMAFVSECHAKCSVDNHPILFKPIDMFFVIIPQYWPKAGF